jgi:acyl-CoA thioesterase II
VSRYIEDTAVEGVKGRYTATLSEEWDIWGPNGGYVAVIALRAMAAESALKRPVSFSCNFLSPGRYEAVELAVTRLKAGRRTEAHRVSMRQGERAILEAMAWFSVDELPGLEHEDASMPEVPTHDSLQTYSELSENYDEWYPYWRSVEGKPCIWYPGEGREVTDPRWNCWMRCKDTPTLDDPVLEAGRSVLWLDMMMWNAIWPAHPEPLPYIAPSLDLTVQFHGAAPDSDWLLCDAHSPMGKSGICSSNGRVWSPDGRLLASGGSQLFCRPAPPPPE